MVYGLDGQGSYSLAAIGRRWGLVKKRMRQLHDEVLARDKAEQIAAKDNIVVEAQRRAEQILAQARADAEATRRDADDYVVDTLVQLQDSLEKVLNQVHNGVRTVQEDQLKKNVPSSSSSVIPEKVEK